MSLKDDATTPNRLDTLPAAPGMPPLDPTINVQNLLLAATKRADDLSSALAMALEQRHTSDRELQVLESRRQDEVRISESKRTDDLAALRDLASRDRAELHEQLARERAEYAEKLRVAESARVDANRSEDQSNARLTAAGLATQVTVLANTQGTERETLRNSAATTATAVATQLEQRFQPLAQKVADLEQSSFIGRGRETRDDPALREMETSIRALTASQNSNIGKAAVADPALTDALKAMAEAQKATTAQLLALSTEQSTRKGQGIGAGQVVAYIFAGLMAMGAVAGIIAFVLKP